MEFHYYYIIQDIVGVLMSFLGIRLCTLTIRFIISGRRSTNTILVLVKYFLITIAGVNLLMTKFSLKSWIVSIVLLFISIIIQDFKLKNN